MSPKRKLCSKVEIPSRKKSLNATVDWSSEVCEYMPDDSDNDNIRPYLNILPEEINCTSTPDVYVTLGNGEQERFGNSHYAYSGNTLCENFSSTAAFHPNVAGNGNCDMQVTPSNWMPLQQQYELVMLPYPVPEERFLHLNFGQQYESCNGSCSTSLYLTESNIDSSPIMTTVRQRTLVEIPIYRGNNIATSESLSMSDSSHSTATSFRRKSPIENQKDVQKRVLIVKNIPPALNKISVINRYFMKFGRIRRIRVQFNDDVRAALVEFERAKHASTAYFSPMPVLNKRCIQVFWEDEVNASGTMNSSVLEESEENSCAKGKSVHYFKPKRTLIKKPSQIKYHNNNGKFISKLNEDIFALEEKRRDFLEKCKDLKEFVAEKQAKSTEPEKDTFFEESVKKCKSNIEYFENRVDETQQKNQVESRITENLKIALMKDLLDTELDLYRLEETDDKVFELLRKIRELQDMLTDQIF